MIGTKIKPGREYVAKMGHGQYGRVRVEARRQDRGIVVDCVVVAVAPERRWGRVVSVGDTLSLRSRDVLREWSAADVDDWRAAAARIATENAYKNAIENAINGFLPPDERNPYGNATTVRISNQSIEGGLCTIGYRTMVALCEAAGVDHDEIARAARDAAAEVAP